MQQYCLLQLTERRFERVLDCEARAIIFAVFLLIGANAAENLDVSETATVLDGFSQLAVKRFRLKQTATSRQNFVATKLAHRVLDEERVSDCITAVAAVVVAATTTIFGVFCRVCAAHNAACALSASPFDCRFTKTYRILASISILIFFGFYRELFVENAVVCHVANERVHFLVFIRQIIW